MRRRAVFKRVQKKAEALASLLRRQTQHLKHALLNIVAMDSDGAAADLRAVQHQVVGASLDRTGISLQLVKVFFTGRGEGVVHRLVTVLLVVVLEHRKVHHPEKIPGAGLDQFEPSAKFQPNLAGRIVQACERSRSHAAAFQP